MAGCDGWITIKIFELIFATFCMIYKRVTDDEANKLFYFLQKFSREWPLLNNVTWEENGAIFTNIVYGGYIIIIIGLIIGQCSGELQKCRKTEKFFLVLGALLFIAAGSLELAAIESVEERLVDNAAILGVFSLLTGFLFIIDVLSSGRRRKGEKLKIIEKYMRSQLTQTEEKSTDLFKTNYINGNIQNGKSDMQMGSKIPVNGVKILPSSPVLNENVLAFNGKGSGYNDSVFYSTEPPVIDGSEVKTHAGRIKSTESFLRSEKGYYPKLRKAFEGEGIVDNFVIPAGYVLVHKDQLQGKSKTKSDSGIGDSPTPPGYAKVIPETKVKPGYVIVPIDQKDRSRKVNSTTDAVNSPEIYYVERSGKKSKPPKLYRSESVMNSSDVSDMEESKFGGSYQGKMKNFRKIPLEYAETDSRGKKYIMQSEDSSEEQKLSYNFRPESRHSTRSLSKDGHSFSKGKVNDGYWDDRENELNFMSRRSSPYRSRTPSPEKPKSILRYDYGRTSQKENRLQLFKDGRYDSLDSQRIAEDLRNLKEITKSNVDLTSNLEQENKILKECLRMEKKQKEKLKHELEDKKKLEDSEEEKNRRVSEREEQYFGIQDLKQSHKDVLEKSHNVYGAKENQIRKGAKEINDKLKQKYLENEKKAAKEAQEFRDLIDERFYFLNEEDKDKKRKEIASKPGTSETHSFSNLINSSKPQKSDSDEVNSSPSTDEEIRLHVETPGSASFKSEALFWLGSDREHQSKSNTPTSPGSPGYVLYTAQNWPESPSPEDRFQFSSKEAQQITLNTPPKTPVLDRIKPDFRNEEKKISQKSRLLEFEEIPDRKEKSQSFRKGLLLRKVDFPKEPVVEIKKPGIVQGSTSTWRKWLYPKPKLQQTRSVPN